MNIKDNDEKVKLLKEHLNGKEVKIRRCEKLLGVECKKINSLYDKLLSNAKTTDKDIKEEIKKITNHIKWSISYET
jgi:hypothetical protein